MVIVSQPADNSGFYLQQQHYLPQETGGVLSDSHPSLGTPMSYLNPVLPYHPLSAKPFHLLAIFFQASIFPKKYFTFLHAFSVLH
jgi:hypothetical protein